MKNESFPLETLSWYRVAFLACPQFLVMAACKASQMENWRTVLSGGFETLGTEQANAFYAVILVLRYETFKLGNNAVMFWGAVSVSRVQNQNHLLSKCMFTRKFVLRCRVKKKKKRKTTKGRQISTNMATKILTNSNAHIDWTWQQGVHTHTHTHTHTNTHILTHTHTHTHTHTRTRIQTQTRTALEYMSFFLTPLL